jgi:hypothetical protein
LCLPKVVCVGHCEILETRRCGFQPGREPSATRTKKGGLIGAKAGKEGRGVVPFDESCEVDALCRKHGRLLVVVVVCCLCAVTCLQRILSLALWLALTVAGLLIFLANSNVAFIYLFSHPSW